MLFIRVAQWEREVSSTNFIERGLAYVLFVPSTKCDLTMVRARGW